VATKNFDGMTEAEMDEVTEIQRDCKKKCFKYFTRLQYGVLGRNNRIDNEDCFFRTISAFGGLHHGGRHRPSKSFRPITICSPTVM
jgi:hypothetical protein